MFLRHDMLVELVPHPLPPLGHIFLCTTAPTPASRSFSVGRSFTAGLNYRDGGRRMFVYGLDLFFQSFGLIG